MASPALAQEQAIPFDIPAQNLSQSLEALSNLSGSQMIYPAELVQGLKGSAVKGSFTPGEALKRLLKGSGLDAKPTGKGSFTLVKQTAAPPTQLDTMTVTATRTPNKSFDLPISL